MQPVPFIEAFERLVWSSFDNVGYLFRNASWLLLPLSWKEDLSPSMSSTKLSLILNALSGATKCLESLVLTSLDDVEFGKRTTLERTEPWSRFTLFVLKRFWCGFTRCGLGYFNILRYGFERISFSFNHFLPLSCKICNQYGTERNIATRVGNLYYYIT